MMFSLTLKRFGQRCLILPLSAVLASLVLPGCPQASSGDGAKPAASEEALPAASAGLAEPGAEGAGTTGTPRPDGSAPELSGCRPLSQDAGPPRTVLAALIEQHPGALLGIDVSHYDGRPDWSQVAASSVSFVYVKATQGIHFHDPCFPYNAEGASANGLLWSAYHVLDPSADGEAQAEVFLKAIGDRKYTLPLVLDIEDHLVAGHPVADVNDKIARWLAYVNKEANHKPMLYLGHDLMKSYFKGTWYFGDHHIWFADYDGKANPDYFQGMPAWSIWQFIDRGEIQGIRSALDVSLYRGTREQLAALLNP
jgi:lysozyme